MQKTALHHQEDAHLRRTEAEVLAEVEAPAGAGALLVAAGRSREPAIWLFVFVELLDVFQTSSALAKNMLE